MILYWQPTYTTPLLSITSDVMTTGMLQEMAIVESLATDTFLAADNPEVSSYYYSTGYIIHVTAKMLIIEGDFTRNCE